MVLPEGTYVHSALSCDGRWYLTDHFNHRLIILEAGNPELLGQKGNNGHQFHYPSGMAIRDDRLFLCDSWNQRIQILSKEGDFLGQVPLTKPHPFEPILPTVALPVDEGLWVLERDAHRVALFPWTSAGIQAEREQEIKGPFQYPHHLAIWGSRFAFLDVSGAVLLQEGELVHRHALPHPTYTKFLFTIDSGVFLFDEVTKEVRFWRFADGVLSAIFSLPADKKMAGIAADKDGCYLFTGKDLEIYPPLPEALPSPRKSSAGSVARLGTLLTKVNSAALAMRDAEGMEGAVDGRWMDGFDLKHPLPGRVLTQRGLVLRDTLLSRLKTLQHFCDACNLMPAEDEIYLGTIENFLVELRNHRLQHLEEIITSGDGASTDLAFAFTHDRILFWLGFTQTRTLHCLQGLLRRIEGVPTAFKDLLQHDGSEGYLECSAIEHIRQSQDFPSLKTQLGKNHNAREALISMAPYCEADHLAFLRDENPLRARARRIIYSYHAELAQTPQSPGDFPILSFPKNLIYLIRWFYWAGLEENFCKLADALAQQKHPHRLAKNALAQIYLLAGKTKEAQQLYADDQNAQPNFVPALVLLRSGKEKTAHKQVGEFPEDQKRAYFHGFLHQLAGRFEKAVPFFQEEIDRSQYPWSVVQLASTYAYQDKLSEALQLLEQHQERLEALIYQYFRGLILRCQGKLEQALSLFETLGKAPMVRYQQGITLRCLNRHEDAITRFEEEDHDFPNWLAGIQMAITFHAMDQPDDRNRVLHSLQDHHYFLWTKGKVYSGQDDVLSKMDQFLNTERQIALSPQARHWQEGERQALYRMHFFSRFLHHGDYVNLY